MSNKVVSGVEIDNNLSLIDKSSKLLHQLAFGAEASGLLTKKEKHECDLINRFFVKAMQNNTYYDVGFNFKAMSFCTYLSALAAEQQIRLAEIACSLSKLGIGAELTRFEELEALQKKILRNQKKMKPEAFTRLLKRVNSSMINRYYVFPKFDFVLDDMRAKFKQSMLPVRFKEGTVENAGKSDHYRMKEKKQTLQLSNKKRM